MAAAPRRIPAPRVRTPLFPVRSSSIGPRGPRGGQAAPAGSRAGGMCVELGAAGAGRAGGACGNLCTHPHSRSRGGWLFGEREFRRAPCALRATPLPAAAPPRRRHPHLRLLSAPSPFRSVRGGDRDQGGKCAGPRPAVGVLARLLAQVGSRGAGSGGQVAIAGGPGKVESATRPTTHLHAHLPRGPSVQLFLPSRRMRRECESRSRAWRSCSTGEGGGGSFPEISHIDLRNALHICMRAAAALVRLDHFRRKTAI